MNASEWTAVAGVVAGGITALGGIAHGRRPYLKLRHALELAQVMKDSGAVNSAAATTWEEHCSRLTHLAAQRGERPSRMWMILRLCAGLLLLAVGATLLLSTTDGSTRGYYRVMSGLFGIAAVLFGGIVLQSVRSFGTGVSSTALNYRRQQKNLMSERTLADYKRLVQKRDGYKKYNPIRWILSIGVWVTGIDLTPEQAAKMQLDALVGCV